MEAVESDIDQDRKDPNQDAVLDILFQVVQQGINLFVRLDGQETHRQHIPLKNVAPPTMLEAVREQLLPVFYDLLPVASVRHAFLSELKAPELESVRLNLDHLVVMVQNTNLSIIKYKDRVIDSSSHKQTLIYNLDGHEFLKDVYESAVSNGNTSLLYKEFHNGWCRDQRKWTDKFEALSSEELIELIHEEKLNRIVSVNMYYLTIIALRENIYLLALLRYLGVEFNILEWDLHEINATNGVDKSSFRCDDFVRYDLFPSLQDQWNQFKKIRNVCYFSVNPVPETEINFLLRSEEYEIICAANSRVEVLNPLRINRVLAAFEFCDPNKLFLDFQFWFHTISYFLATRVQCDYLQKIKIRADLVKLHFDGISLLKYETLEQLDTDRKVTLYGDQGWAKLFPEYFSGEYLQKELLWEKVQKPDYLYLQMNNAFSYLESNAVVGYALSRSTPFIGFPAVVKTEEFKGFEAIEYNSSAELNGLIENINDRVSDERLADSLDSYVEIMSRSKIESYDNIARGYRETDQFYRQWCDRHFKQFEAIAVKYIAQHEQELLQYLNRMYDPNIVQWRNSPFAERGYIQKLMSS